MSSIARPAIGASMVGLALNDLDRLQAASSVVSALDVLLNIVTTGQ